MTPTPPHPDGLWRQCCQCKCFYDPARQPLAVPPTPEQAGVNISHGLCLTCYPDVADPKPQAITPKP